MNQLQTTNYTYNLYSENELILESRRANTTGKYGLWFGIHRGRLTSREDSNPTFEYDTYQEAVDQFEREAHHFARLGCYIWHASIIAPDGTRSMLVGGAPYRR
jgi:hypothetical protein